MQKNFLNTVEVTKRQRKVIVALRKCRRVIDQPFCFSSGLVYFSLWLSPKRTRAKIRVNGLPRRQYTTRITFREFQKKCDQYVLPGFSRMKQMQEWKNISVISIVSRT